MGGQKRFPGNSAITTRTRGLDWLKPFRIMKGLFAVLIAVACVVVTGCGKGKESRAAGVSSDASLPDKPLPPPPPAVKAFTQNAPAENVVGDVDPFLTQQLRIFIRDKGRMPQSFAELAGTRLDSIPNPPLGKKWVIDNATKEVKAARTQ
jgi:hypothetical protein